MVISCKIVLNITALHVSSMPNSNCNYSYLTCNTYHTFKWSLELHRLSWHSSQFVYLKKLLGAITAVVVRDWNAHRGCAERVRRQILTN